VPPGLTLGKEINFCFLKKSIIFSKKNSAIYHSLPPAYIRMGAGR
jgi:hypothetical protein